MRAKLLKSLDFIDRVEMMYIKQNWIGSKRKTLVLEVADVSIWTNCHLRYSKRTFKIDNVPLVPVITKEKAI